MTDQTQNKGNKRILVVDDEPDIVELLREVLEPAGFDVDTATDGEEALGKARGSVPDLILLDVVMPKIDGFEVLRRLKKDRKTIAVPVIMLTGQSSSRSVEEAMEQYVEKYIPKPFQLNALVTEIKKTFAIRDGVRPEDVR